MTNCRQLTGLAAELLWPDPARSGTVPYPCRRPSRSTRHAAAPPVNSIPGPFYAHATMCIVVKTTVPHIILPSISRLSVSGITRYTIIFLASDNRLARNAPCVPGCGRLP